MGDKNIIIAVHGAEKDATSDFESSCATGLLNGFKAIGIKAYSTSECLEKNIAFNMSIGFNKSEIGSWQRILSNNVTNILWSLDAAFGANFDAIEQFAMFEKFILFEVTPADTQVIGRYFQNLKHGFIPYATDTSLWKRHGLAKETDVVLFDSIVDYETAYKELKETMPPLVYELMMQIRNISLKNPQLTFGQICEILEKTCELNFDKEQYLMLFKNLAYTIASEQKVLMVKNLSNTNLNIFGNEIWKKYLDDTSMYKGECTYNESVSLMEKAKISLYCHPVTLGLGISEKVLNASAVNTFSLVSNSPSLKAEFGESLGYFNHITFDDIQDRVDYFLENEEERNEKSQKAFETTLQKHTWAQRAQSIIDIIN